LLGGVWKLEIEDVIGVEEASSKWLMSSGYIKNLCAKGRVISKKVGKTWVIDGTQQHPGLLYHVSVLTGKSFVKEVTISKDSKYIKIVFFESYDEFLATNQNSNIDFQDYQNYFKTGDRINKILVEESVRLLRQFPVLENVKILIPFENDVFKINLYRDQLDSYLGFNINTLSVQDKTWHTEFLQKYSNNRINREKFIKHFVNSSTLEK
jgi:hypothetical protein